MARLKTYRSTAGHGSFASEDDGFSLLESVVALTLFVIVLTFGAVGVTQTIHLTGVTSAKVQAANLATQEIERLRLANLTGHALVLNPPSGTVPAGYTAQETTGSCVNGDLLLTVAIAWDGDRSVTYNSELAC